jgi:hypothetical protein
MTSHVTRLYVAAASLLAFFLAWAGIGAHPWKSSPTVQGQQAQALAIYEQRLQRDLAVARRLSRAQPATTTPQVRVVTLPPLTTTRTS